MVIFKAATNFLCILDFLCITIYHHRMLMYKIFDTSLVNSIYNNLNIKRKLLICNANINFNRTCLKKRIIPNFVNFGLSITFLL
jgi:hypothetical protein